MEVIKKCRNLNGMGHSQVNIPCVTSKVIFEVCTMWCRAKYLRLLLVEADSGESCSFSNAVVCDNEPLFVVDPCPCCNQPPIRGQRFTSY